MDPALCATQHQVLATHIGPDPCPSPFSRWVGWLHLPVSMGGCARDVHAPVCSQCSSVECHEIRANVEAGGLGDTCVTLGPEPHHANTQRKGKTTDHHQEWLGGSCTIIGLRP